MNVILLERVENLGQMGDVVKVKPGYARNFLIPNKKALRATDANKKVFEAQRAEIEAQNLKRKQEAEAVATKVEGAKAVLVRQAGEAGQLYGSVSARDIADALGEQGFKVGRNQIVLDRPIKELGLHDVTVRLHPEVAVTVIANVARSEAEAEEQFKRGGAVVSEEEPAEEPVGMPEEEGIDTEQLVQDLLEEERRAHEVAADAQESEMAAVEDEVTPPGKATSTD